MTRIYGKITINLTDLWEGLYTHDPEVNTLRVIVKFRGEALRPEKLERTVKIRRGDIDRPNSEMS